MTKIHLGCGSNVIPGWLNYDWEVGDKRDVVPWDLSKRNLPHMDGTVDFIYSEHFVEHIEPDQCLGLFKECYRILKKGGAMRVSTPNLLVVVDDYRRGRLDRWHSVGWEPKSPCQLINGAMREWGHKWLYDLQDLTSMLCNASFSPSKIILTPWRESKHQHLCGLETRPNCLDLIVEAVK